MPLLVGQRRQVEVEEMPQGLGMVFERLLRSLLQFPPSTPRMIRRMRDVPQQTQPFHISTRDVPFRDARFQILRTGLFGMQQRIQQLRRAFAIVIRQAVFEIAVMIHETIRATAHRRESF